MNCNFAVWAVLLCVSAHQHRVPFLGIQPSNVPMIDSLEQLATLPGTVDNRIWDKTLLCKIIFLLLAAVIIPWWRIRKSEPEPPAISLPVLLSLTFALVVIFLLDLTNNLLCARWEHFSQVIFDCIWCWQWFLTLAEVVEKTCASCFICWFVEVCDCVTTGRVVWDKFSGVVCSVLRPRIVNWCVRNLTVLQFLWVVCRQNEAIACCKVFSYREWIFKQVETCYWGGTPAKISRMDAVQGKCKPCCVGSDASSPRSAMLGRDVHSEVAASVEFGGRWRKESTIEGGARELAICCKYKRNQFPGRCGTNSHEISYYPCRADSSSVWPHAFGAWNETVGSYAREKHTRVTVVMEPPFEYACAARCVMYCAESRHGPRWNALRMANSRHEPWPTRPTCPEWLVEWNGARRQGWSGKMVGMRRNLAPVLGPNRATGHERSKDGGPNLILANVIMSAQSHVMPRNAGNDRRMLWERVPPVNRRFWGTLTCGGAQRAKQRNSWDCSTSCSPAHLLFATSVTVWAVWIEKWLQHCELM